MREPKRGLSMRKHNGNAAKDDGVDDSFARSRVSHWLQVAGGTVGIRVGSGLRLGGYNVREP